MNRHAHPIPGFVCSHPVGRKTTTVGFVRQLFIVWLISLSGAAWAATVVPFQLTGYDGSVSLEYELDDLDVTRAGGSVNQRTQNSFKEEFFVNTHSYVYHPNLLKLDAGLGMTFYQGETDSNGTKSTLNNDLTKLSFRASLLEKKPYPSVFFYDQDNTTYSPSLGERLVQTNTRYGVNLILREPFVPLSLNLDVHREQQDGRGETQVIDSMDDVVSLQAYRSFGSEDYLQGSFRRTNHESASGSLQLPIMPISDTINDLELGGRKVFGADDQFALTTNATYTNQTGSTPRDDYSFMPDLRWRYSEDLDSYYQYSLSSSKQENIDSTNQYAIAGVNYRVNKEISTTGRLNWNDNRMTGVHDRRRGGQGQALYSKKLGELALRMSVGMDYELSDRESTSNTAPVVGESIVLVGLEPVLLANPYVDVTSVVVSNADRTQIFVEDIDYRLVTVGSRTSIERLATGSILDGEEVLVDYVYQTGGTFTSSEFGQAYLASVGFYDYYIVFVNYRRDDVSLVSGNPTLPLNSSSNLRYGVSVTNYPLPLRIRGNAKLEFERQREDVNPFDSTDFELSISAPYGRRTRAQAAFRKASVDNLNSVEDSDLTSYHLSLATRPIRTLFVTAEVNNQKDTGGTLQRDTWTALVKADWRLYRLQASALADYRSEQQGDVQQDGFNFKLTLRRDF